MNGRNEILTVMLGWLSGCMHFGRLRCRLVGWCRSTPADWEDNGGPWSFQGFGSLYSSCYRPQGSASQRLSRLLQLPLPTHSNRMSEKANKSTKDGKQKQPTNTYLEYFAECTAAKNCHELELVELGPGMLLFLYHVAWRCTPGEINTMEVGCQTIGSLDGEVVVSSRDLCLFEVIIMYLVAWVVVCKSTDLCLFYFLSLFCFWFFHN